MDIRSDLFHQIALFFIISLLVFGAIVILTTFAERLNLIDVPDKRKRHKDPSPMIGGIAIYLVVFVAMTTLNLSGFPFWLMLLAGIVVLSGALDDAFTLSVKTRFSAQLVAVLFVIAGCDVWIRSIGFDFWSQAALFQWLGIPFTALSVIGLTNAFNMSDGIDGLASGQFLLGIAAILLSLFMGIGDLHPPDWLILWSASVFMFWLINLSWTPLRPVFLGDAGSLLLGFILAWALVYYSQNSNKLIHPVAALWCVTIPVSDSLIVILRRIKSKQSPFVSDRTHLHHYFLDMGIRPRIVLVFVLGMSAFINAMGVFITYQLGPVAGLVAFGLFVWAFGAMTWHWPNAQGRSAGRRAG